MGTWLDATLDRGKEILIFVTLVYYILKNPLDTWLLSNQAEASIWLATLGILALGISFMISYVKAKGEAILASQSQMKASELNRVLAGGCMGYEVRVIILTLGLFSQQLDLAFILIIFGGLITLKIRISKLLKRLK